MESLQGNKDAKMRPRMTGLLVISLLIALIVLAPTLRLLTELWWFEAVGYSGVFWTLLVGRSLSWLAVFLIFVLFLGLNYRLALYLTRERNFRALPASTYYEIPPDAVGQLVNFLATAAIVFLAIVAAAASTDSWETVLKFWQATDFQISDPIYQRDISFYIFQFPFYLSLRSGLLALFTGGLALAIPVYLLKGNIDRRRGWANLLSHRVKAHLLSLLAAIAVLVGFSYWLQRYQLLYSTDGVVFGTGYTDVHTRQIALILMGFLALTLAVIFLISIRQKHLTLPVFSVGIYIIIAFIFQGLIPILEQQLVVSPNELTKETPYIEHNIAYTRQAYGLDRAQTQLYAVQSNLNLQTLENNSATIDNIRLWDDRPLLSTYRELQEIRPYYHFQDVDIDRYTLDRTYRQVMLSVRELAYDQVPQRGQTWINQHLKYTHGYGLVMSPVNQVSSEGLPQLLIKDIPPVVETDLEINQPRIYYGENTDRYIFTGMDTDEFDYPLGKENAAYRYSGKGGVSIPGFFQRLVYAVHFGDLKILISGYFTPESRILYHREIGDRVQRIVPFLQLDNDPYPVVVDGRLQWIIDAYTTSDLYPYSEPYIAPGIPKLNYIRNSVKIVVDAYDGTIQCFAIDEDDPILTTYRRIFPDLFQPASAVPEAIQKHFRYPIDFFKVQAQKYLVYHTTAPEVFYNREDMWALPLQIYEGQEETMNPYYTIMRLPQLEKEEFVLILPFTPIEKSNMVAWMAARSDGENYGKTLVYEFSKQQLIFGPLQQEARIDQNPAISEQLTLWSQKGSKVIRGDMLIIPIEDSLLYIEPIYLRAETGQLPELKRTIAIYDRKSVMEADLDSALRALFDASSPILTSPITDNEETTEAPSLVRSALQTYQQAQAALKAGNWAEYGRLNQELEQILLRLNSQ
ncbi:MAG: UPF0182 family protein [Cyanobacteria bacterium P01_E01_bin.42]